MLVPISWLKQYVDVPQNISVLTRKLTLAGHMLDKIHPEKDDTVVDLELRGNREDLFCILGIAHEIHALFDTPLKNPSLPDLTKLPQATTPPQIRVQIQAKDLINRFTWIEIANLQVSPSPAWLKKLLTKVKISPVNNIVDATNYTMYLIGQPLHAFDRDKIQGQKLTLRRAQNKDLFKTFEDTQIKTTPKDLIAADSANCLGLLGVIGEKSSGVTEKTTSILLEAGNYYQPNIRRSSLHHKLRTDAALRLEKNIDPTLPPRAIKLCAALIIKLAGGKIVKGLQDYSPKTFKNPWKKIIFPPQEITRLGGVNIHPQKVLKIFKLLGLPTKKKNPALEVAIPWRRSDLEGPADLVEEILRIIGYDQIPPQPLFGSTPDPISPPHLKTEDQARQVLPHLGFNENIFDSFISKKRHQFFFEKHPPRPISVANPTSPETALLRTSLLPDQIITAQKLLRLGTPQASLFEIGKIYYRKAHHHHEESHVSGLIFSQNTNNQAVLSLLTEKIRHLLHHLGITQSHLVLTTPHPLMEPSSSVNFCQNQLVLAQVGLLKASLAQALHLPTNFFLFDILSKNLTQATKNIPQVLQPQFPPVIQDLTFNLPEKTHLGLVINTIKAQSKLIAQVRLTDSFKNARTFRIWFQHPQRNLTDQQIQPLRKKIIQAVSAHHQGQFKA